ncbi:MAG: ATP-binding protein [Terracidiphilus sp.]
MRRHLSSRRRRTGALRQLGDSAAVTAMLDRLLHHGHILKCGPRSWRTKTSPPENSQ